MENLYQVPCNPCKNEDRKMFWTKVVSDQKHSGLSAKKFCQLHQLKYSTYKGYRYGRSKKKKKTDCNNIIRNKNKIKNINNNNYCSEKFIPLQVASNTTINSYCESSIQIVFKNNNKLLLPIDIPESKLFLIINTVAGLIC